MSSPLSLPAVAPGMLPPHVTVLAAASKTLFMYLGFFSHSGWFCLLDAHVEGAHGDGHFQGLNSPVVFCAVSCTRTGGHKTRSRRGG